MVDPSQIFLEVRKNFDLAYLLESLDGFRPGSRFSVIGCGSLFHLKFSGYQREVEGGTDFVDLSRERLENMNADLDPLEAMKRAMFMDEMQVLGLNLPRYILGVTGYLSYDYVRKRIELESNTEEDLNHPLYHRGSEKVDRRSIRIWISCTIVFWRRTINAGRYP
ncbi:hypothetical protein AKJ62_02730 [candidate division MSBL1 archaeon SCGC-AAA259D14]|uniref:Anthranilate synthase component I N-terminal domain-containing protein n=1 Tax=candidate division MSBL1 archaeon SCGC-AAA259D14 TaxID=1698261 RepID=A0A133U5Z2_9EURY|nr:hypothetical protein AKJ62_02730 [candidate division MSBL1 archaeon SCGC-AAA259D14]